MDSLKTGISAAIGTKHPSAKQLLGKHSTDGDAQLSN